MTFLLWLMVLFIFLPFLELAIFLDVGRNLGFLPALFLTVATGLLGLRVARQQGMHAWRNAQTALLRGENPSLAVLDSLGTLLAGLALLLPGFFTDCIGLLLLLRPVRLLFMGFLLGQLFVRPAGRGGHGQRGARAGGYRSQQVAGNDSADAESETAPPASEMIIDITPKESRREP